MQALIEQQHSLPILFSVGVFATRTDGLSIAFAPFSKGYVTVTC
jgi:hypothetical protein